jgi:hypothetical protein
MNALPQKVTRKIDHAVNQLFGKKGFYVPKWPDDYEKQIAFSREVQLSDNRVVFLTDIGHESFREIVKVLDDLDVFDGLAASSDIWSACRSVLQDLLSKSHRPDHGDEFVALAGKIVESEISNRTFVAALYGIEFKAVDELQLGSLRAIRPSVEMLDKHGVERSSDRATDFVEHSKSALWLTGTVRGTEPVANRRFREKAQLATGVLAIVAGSAYERGAHGFRIGIAMSPEEAYGRAVYLSWSETDKSLVVTYQGPRAQRLTVDSEMRADIEASLVGKQAFAILEKSNRSELEEAIVGAMHWYSDAHRDEVLVMRFLKYWSCIEVFFSGERDGITAAVSTGLAATLTHGHIDVAKPSQYHELRKRVSAMYNQRSKATHRAAYGHIGEKEVSDLSQWVSWLIINAMMFVHHGFRSTKQMTAWSKDVHLRNSPPRSWLQTFQNCIRRVGDSIRG